MTGGESGRTRRTIRQSDILILTAVSSLTSVVASWTLASMTRACSGRRRAVWSSPALFLGVAQGAPVRARRRVPRQPLSSGNHLFPTQVLISPTSVVHYTPQWFGRLEHSIHMAHVASVRIDTKCFSRMCTSRPPAGQARSGATATRRRTRRGFSSLSSSIRRSTTGKAGAVVSGPVASDNETDASPVDDLTFSARRATATRPEPESPIWIPASATSSSHRSAPESFDI